MASPWKFIARLVLPRREQKPDNGLLDDVRPEALAIADLTETPAEENPVSADRPASTEPPRHYPSNPASAKPAPPQEAGREVHHTVDENAKAVSAADPALSDDTDIAVTVEYKAAKLEPTERGPRRQRIRGKKAESVVVVAQVSPFVHTADDMSLDAQIRLLRGQLASKLRLQNAKLKKMLERFER